MTRVSLAVLAGTALLVAATDHPVADALDEVPMAACVRATAQTAEARLEHLVQTLRLVEAGISPRSVTAAPSAAALASCPG